MLKSKQNILSPIWKSKKTSSKIKEFIKKLKKGYEAKSIEGGAGLCKTLWQ